MPRAILLDTGVLLRYLQPSDPSHETVRSTIVRLLAAGETLVVTPQGIRELWGVLTRPVEVNGFGRTVADAQAVVKNLLSSFLFLDDEPGIFTTWLNLVSTHEVKGVKVHDANHAAAALHHGLTHVLTLNPSDFNRYSGANLQPLTLDEA